MKVALVNPPWSDRDDPMLWGVRAGSRWPHMQRRPAPGRLPHYVPFPFFMAHATAVLRQAGYRADLLDAVAENMDVDATLERLKQWQPDVVFAEVSTPSLRNDLAFLQRLRAVLPASVLVCGGTHPPEWVDRLLREHAVPDYWLAGEYEQALTALVQRLDGAGHTRVPGLIGRQEPFEGRACVEQLDDMPPPPYDAMPVSHYADPVCGLPGPTAFTWLSRGCPYGCTFCVWPQVLYGERRYRARSIERALDEVEVLVRDHGCESFYFDDDTTNIGTERMLQLAGAVEARGLDRLPWSMMARADCMAPQVIERLAAAGLYSIKYGVESAAPSLRNACDKGLRLDALVRAVETTRRANVKMHLTFMFGLPGETRQTIRETLAFALDVRPETAQFTYCVPFPGTQFHRMCEENGWLTTTDWSAYLGLSGPVLDLPGLGVEGLREEYECAVTRWNDFVLERLERRRGNLVEVLRTMLGEHGVWHGLGDMVFAGLPNHDDVMNRRVEQIQRADVLVVADPRDEEKLYRRLLAGIRAGEAPERPVLRLYRMDEAQG